MFRATGPAQTQVRVDLAGVGVITALLYNFDFDDFADKKYRPLKNEHIKFLSDRVLPLLENNRGNIWMQGSASRIGTSAWNMELSQTRVGRVANFLSTRGILAEQMQLDAVGETLAAAHSEDDARDRSVRIWVLPQVEFEFAPIVPAPLPRKPPPIPKITQHFKIALFAGLSASHPLKVAKILEKVKLSGGAAGDLVEFIICDQRSSLACLYGYGGLGLGFGAKDFVVSGTDHGDWTSFETEKPISCSQFNGWARFTTIGTLKWSYNWISLKTPPGVKDVDSLSISTGTTIGAGASSTVGYFIQLTRPFRFRGP
jgi:hypothetical protein